MAKKKAPKPHEQDVTAATAAPAAESNSKVWTIFALVSATAGARVAKKALNSGWTAATGKQPPANPADPDVEMWEAVAWAAVSGTAIALARMLASRRAANYYVKSTGHLPGQLAADKPTAPTLTKN